jgi:hypothetical protein
MKKIITIMLFAIIPSIAINAQEKKSIIKFSSIIQAGILEGAANKTAVVLQTINGVKVNAWFAGIGVGLDYYDKKRSIPLFISLRKELFQKKITPFLYLDGGYNFSWLREEEKSAGTNSAYKELNGFYYDAGVGYKFTLKSKMALGLSAGYSLKEQGEEYVLSSWFPIFPPPTEALPEKYEYTLRRINIKISCWF